MNCRQAKKARAIANREAKRQNLWKRGIDSILSKWWRKLLAKWFPSFQKKYSNAVGSWYKRQLKTWARQAYAFSHDSDQLAFQAAKRKVDRMMKKRDA